MEPVVGEVPKTNREIKLDLADLFIDLVEKRSMDEDEARGYFQIMHGAGNIKDEDLVDLNHKLDVRLGKTPEQIREAKLGLGRLFIGLVGDKSMESDEARDYFQKMRDAGHITQDDLNVLNSELEVRLGKPAA